MKEDKTTKMLPEKIHNEDKKTVTIATVKTDVKPQKPIERHKSVREIIEKLELTVAEKKQRETELQIELDDFTKNPQTAHKRSREELEKERLQVKYATLKDKVVLHRNFRLESKRGIHEHVEIGFKYANGKWEIDQLGYSGASFELKDGFPSRIWSRFGTQPWVFDVEYEGEIPEAYKRLINEELSKELAKAKSELETKTKENAEQKKLNEEAMKKLRESNELETALYEKKYAELLKALDDSQVKNKLKKMLHINS